MIFGDCDNNFVIINKCTAMYNILCILFFSVINQQKTKKQNKKQKTNV